MANYQDFKGILEKYVRSVSFSTNYYCDEDDVRQEMLIKLHGLDLQNIERPFGYVKTALQQVRQNFISKYENEMFRRESFNQDVFTSRKTYPALSNINLYFTVNRIKKDINDHCLSRDRMGRQWRLHEAEEYHYILNSLLAGVGKEEIRNYMGMGKVTFKKRWLFIRKLFVKYYEPSFKKVFAQFDNKTLGKIQKDLKKMSIKEVARKHGCDYGAVTVYNTQLRRHGFDRNWNDRGARPMVEEIKEVISKTTGRNYADIAAKTKAKMEEIYKYKDNYIRYYSLVIKHKELCKGLLTA